MTDRLRLVGRIVVGLLAAFGLVSACALVHVASIPLDSNGRVVSSRLNLSQIESALEQYRMDSGAYPSEAAGLAALAQPPPSCPSISLTYLTAHSLEDAWGAPFIYRQPGLRNPETYDLCSRGPDGRVGGSGHAADLANFAPAICE